MPTLLDSLSQLLTPDLLNKIGGATGLDANLVSRGLGSVGPLLTGALASSSSTPQGLDGLMKLIPQDGGAGLGNLAGLLKGGAPAGLLSGMFGQSGLGAAGKTLDQALGFKVSPLIGVAAPVVMGLLSKLRSEKQLDSAGVATALRTEQDAFFARGGENAELARKALDAGAEANALRTRFTDDQWLTIRLAPLAAAQVVMMASPSGPIGAIKEAGTVVRAIGAMKATAGATSLLGIAFEDELKMDELTHLGGKDAKKDNMLSTIRTAVATIAAVSPGDAIPYRRFLAEVAMKVAEASKEGGFLGIGGTLVSDDEKVAVNEVGVAAGVA
jgi:hypothetical protein